MTELYDVIVVGAGPGGATAAYFLGEAGQRVLLLDKATPPRYKACGGGLSAHMLEAIFPFSFDAVIDAHMAYVGYTMDGQTVRVPIQAQAVRTVMRATFDAHLLAQTRAEVRTGLAVRQVTEAADRVRVETANGQAFEGHYLIGADGANSVVAHAVGLRRGKQMAAALEAEVPLTPEAQQRLGGTLLLIFGDVKAGYAWIFPKAEYLSVGVMGWRPRPGELQAGLANMVARYGLSLEGVPVKGHPIPVQTRREPIMTRRTLLVGDAAGLADPFSGEGIRLAIKSGKLAAEALAAGQPEQYPAWVWRDVGRKHRLALVLTRLFYRFPRLSFKLGACNPLITPALLNVITDRSDYARVFLTAALTFPRFALSEAAARLAGLLGGPHSREKVRARLLGGQFT